MDEGWDDGGEYSAPSCSLSSRAPYDREAPWRDAGGVRPDDTQHYRTGGTGCDCAEVRDTAHHHGNVDPRVARRERDYWQTESRHQGEDHWHGRYSQADARYEAESRDRSRDWRSTDDTGRTRSGAEPVGEASWHVSGAARGGHSLSSASETLSSSSPSSAPHFVWLGDAEFGVSSAKRAALSGVVCEASVRLCIVHALQSILAHALKDYPGARLESPHQYGSPSLLAAAGTASQAATSSSSSLIVPHPNCNATGESQLFLFSSPVWLPPNAAKATLSVGFASVGLGNKLFLYFVNFIAALLLGKRFEMFPGHKSVIELPAAVDFASLTATVAAVEEVVVAASKRASVDDSTEAPPVDMGSAGCVVTHATDAIPLCIGGWKIPSATLPSVPLETFLADRYDIGRILVQYQPSFLAAGHVIQRWGAVVGSASAGFVSGCCTESVLRGPRLLPGDWVVHVRTGDVWLEPGERQRVNACYRPPPAWWYKWLALTYKPARVVIVSVSATSTLVSSVAAALREGGCGEVVVQCGTERGDFGLLMRASVVVPTVSSFSWWAALLSSHVPSTYLPVSPLPAAKITSSVPTTPARGMPLGEPAVSVDKCAACVTVHMPLTGMMHPHSRHRVHSNLSLASSSCSDGSATRELRVCAYELEVVDDWCSSPAQQRAVLDTTIPDWFVPPLA